MILHGLVDLPGGRRIYGQIDVRYAGTVKDWWNGSGHYVVDEDKMKLIWDNGNPLKREEREEKIKLQYDLFVREVKISEYVLEQILILGGEPYDAQ